MAQFKCEACYLPATLNISASGHIHEQSPAMGGELPVRIVQNDQDLWVDIEIESTGNAVGLFWGHFHVDVFFEQMGPNEGPVGPFTWTGNNGVPGNGLLVGTETIRIPVPAGSFAPVLHRGQNAFRVVATFTRHAAQGVRPIAGFADLGLIQIYQD